MGLGVKITDNVCIHITLPLPPYSYYIDEPGKFGKIATFLYVVKAAAETMSL